jgi:plasmid segregation protein ParM
MRFEPTMKATPAALGVDVGYSSTKIAWLADGHVVTSSFPSLAERAGDTRSEFHLPGLAMQGSRHLIEVCGARFFVDTTDAAPTQNVSGRTRLDQFSMTHEYAALVFAAILHSGMCHVSLLVLGLPCHTRDQFASDLVGRFRGSHNIGQHEIRIDEVMVLPQPVGSYVSMRSANSDVFRTGTASCVIDCGWGTVDTLVSTNTFKVDLNRSGGVPGGAAAVLTAVAEQLRHDHPGRHADLDRIDQCIVNRRLLIHNSREIDLAPYLQLAAHVAEQTAARILDRLVTAEDLSIVLAGGASHYFRKAIEDLLERTIPIVERPRFSNVIGFLIAGEAARGRNK